MNRSFEQSLGGLRSQLQEFGLNPRDWILRPQQLKNQKQMRVSIYRALDRKLYFQGIAQFEHSANQHVEKWVTLSLAI